MQKSRPLIGITPGLDEKKGCYTLHRDYAAMVRRAGGEPLVLSYGFGSVQVLQGLILSGGGDFAAGFAGYEDGPELKDVCPARDEFEARVLEKALGRGLPVLGICRGCQLINLFFGGTLVRDLASSGVAEQHMLELPGMHGVECEPGTLAHRMLGGRVVSTHHQAVERPGSGLAITARSPGGVAECIEHSSGRVLGLQTHPERMRLLAPFEWLLGLAGM